MSILNLRPYRSDADSNKHAGWDGSVIDFGTLAASCPDRACIHVIVKNLTKDEHAVSFSVCDNLMRHFGLSLQSIKPFANVSARADSSSTNEFDYSSSVSTDMNLLHAQSTAHPLHEFPVSADSEVTFAMDVVASGSELRHQSQTVLGFGDIHENGHVESVHESSTIQSVACEGMLFCSINGVDNTAGIKIQGRIGKSKIEVDKQCINFGRCNTGVWIYQPLSIRNLSEDVSTNVRFNLTETSSPSVRVSLCLLKNEMERYEWDESMTIKSTEEISLTLGIECLNDGYIDDIWICVENERNVEDVWYVKVVIDAMMELSADRLFVNCENEMLDFGDCYAQRYTFKDVIIQNFYAHTQTISLLCDGRQQVEYQVLQDENDDENDDNGNIKSANKEEQDDDPQKLSRDNDNDSKTDLGKKESSKSVLQPQRNRLTDSVTLRSGQHCCIRAWYYPSVPIRRPHEERGKLQARKFQLLFQLKPTVISTSTGNSGAGSTSGTTASTSETGSTSHGNVATSVNPSSSSSVNSLLEASTNTHTNIGIKTRRITAKARVCEGNIRLDRDEEYLGDCDVLTTYTRKVTVMNCSDLSTTIRLSYVSQCVSSVNRFDIAAHDTYILTLTFIPRQVNETYHKEITFYDEHGRDHNEGNLMFTLRANCVDRHGISLHALFYKLITPGPGNNNDVDFGVTVCQFPSISAFRIVNQTDHPLLLKFNLRYQQSGFADDIANGAVGNDLGINSGNDSENGIQLYIPYWALPMKTWFEKQLFHQEYNDQPQLDDYDYQLSSALLLDQGMAIQELQRRRQQWGDEKENHSGMESEWEQLVEGLMNRGEGESGLLESMPTDDSGYEGEIAYMKRQEQASDTVGHLLHSGYLHETDSVCIDPNKHVSIIVSLRLDDEDVHPRQKKLQTIEKSLFIRMLRQRYDKCRRLSLSARVCKSQMCVSPLTRMNFGMVSQDEPKYKQFSIVNLCQAPIIYCIQQHHHDDGDQQLKLYQGSHSHGVIRPFSHKVVRFVFLPTLHGFFQHSFLIENLLDPSASCQLVVKAFVKPKKQT